MRPRRNLAARLTVLGASLLSAALLFRSAGSDEQEAFQVRIPAVANDELRPGGTATPPRATSTATATATATYTPTPTQTPTATPKPDNEASIEEVGRSTYGLYMRVTLRVKDDDGLASVTVDFGSGAASGQITFAPVPILFDATAYGVLGQTLTPSITTTDLKGGTTTRVLTPYTPTSRVFEVRTTFEVLAYGNCDYFNSDNELLITASVSGVSLGTKSVYDPPAYYVDVPLLYVHHYALQVPQQIPATVTVYEQDAFLEGANDFLGTKTGAVLLFVNSSSGFLSSVELNFSQASPACTVKVRVTFVIHADPHE